MSSRVSFAGPVAREGMAEMYASADIFVLGSHREGSGYAVLEALACDVIPALTDIPSFRGLTNEGRIGALWHPGDSQSLADALSRIVARDLDSQRIEARRFFEDNFSWNAIGRRAVEIYREFSRT
jgi:glycosyltransferase involved in cell wall biosynthesis